MMYLILVDLAGSPHDGHSDHLLHPLSSQSTEMKLDINPVYNLLYDMMEDSVTQIDLKSRIATIQNVQVIMM